MSQAASNHRSPCIAIIGMEQAGKTVLTTVLAKRLSTIAALGAGVGTVAVLAPLPPTRKLLLKIKSPGEGPSETERANRWVKVKFVGEGGGKRVVTEVSGGDPGVFAMAAAVCEALEKGPGEWRTLDLAIVPGITSQ